MLVLRIDDFTIRKCHTYNTGLHDLRGGTILDVIPGRRLEELRKYYQENPQWADLQPIAAVMDLAKGYHTFIKEVYPSAIRIANRFHVNRYVKEALSCSKTGPERPFPTCTPTITRIYRLQGKRADQLTEKEVALVNQFLQYSDVLSAVYKWK